MRKFFYIFMAATMMVTLAACESNNQPKNPEEEGENPEYLDSTKESSMELYVGAIPVYRDTTILVSEIEESLSGAEQMGIRGSISGVKGFRVIAKRSVAGEKDELCAGQQCMPGDGELEQIFDFNLMGAESASWYTHYTVGDVFTYTVDYEFINYNRSIHVKVLYHVVQP